MTSPAPLPPEIAQQDVSRMGQAPPGFCVPRHAVPHDIGGRAAEMLVEPYGAEEYRASTHGGIYFLRVEPHWWFGADPAKPSHWHKGVTVYAHTD